jgi:tetratricopeptide (TPR) repeat protein
MKAKKLSIFTLFLSLVFVAKGQNNDIISSLRHLPSQQLLDTGNYYFQKNSFDTALICYSLIINNPRRNADSAQQQRIIRAYNQSALIYQNLHDYRMSYEFLTKALTLSQETNDVFFRPRIYNNIGNIYYNFDKYDIAKTYYSTALSLSQDTMSTVHILSNLGTTEVELGNNDSAFIILNNALQISKKHGQINFSSIMNNIAHVFYEQKQYDSSFYYLRIALDEARANNILSQEATYLSNLGNLFFETGVIDSALHYVGLSNVMAIENNFFMILAKNYLLLSKIEKSKGRYKNSLNYFELSSNLKDSILSVQKYSEINQIRHIHEISKANQQIEQLATEQQIKERTIHYQKIIQYITFTILLLVIGVLFFVFFQNRKLNTAYRILFEKDLKITEYQKEISENHPKRFLTDDTQVKLLDKILTIMEDTSIICDVEFSIDRLADLVQSNEKYVSQTINTILKKNFRLFLNEYRIREAQKLLSESDVVKYTIEAIAIRVGFKSRTTFRTVFQEIVGVTPNFYLKSMQDLLDS